MHALGALAMQKVPEFEASPGRFGPKLAGSGTLDYEEFVAVLSGAAYTFEK